MAEQVEYVVVGLGALGSATAYELADREPPARRVVLDLLS